MFNSDDWGLVIQHLGLSMTDEPNVKAAMTALETDHPEVVPTVQSLLTQLTELENTISSELSSSNSALVRADVLEWEGSEQRNAGMFQQRARIVDQIYRLLNLEAFDVILPGAEESNSSNSIPVEINHGWCS